MIKNLVEYIPDFLEYCELDRNLSQTTVKTYGYFLGSFATWLNTTGKSIRPENLDDEIIRQYRLYLSRYENPVTGPLSKTTQNYFMIVIRALLRFLLKKGVKTLSPEQIDLGKNRDRNVKFLTRQHLDQILARADTSKPQGLRDRAILELLFSTGLRVSELAGLNRDKVNLDTREFGVVGKGGHTRVVFISSRAKDWLSRYLTTRQDQARQLFIHYRGKGDERLSVRSIERMVKRYAREAKLPDKATPHTLRHTFATDLLRNGADLRSVQELLGHKNVSTTQIYTHVTNPQLKEVFNKFHDK